MNNKDWAEAVYRLQAVERGDQDGYGEVSSLREFRGKIKMEITLASPLAEVMMRDLTPEGTGELWENVGCAALFREWLALQFLDRIIGETIEKSLSSSTGRADGS